MGCNRKRKWVTESKLMEVVGLIFRVTRRRESDGRRFQNGRGFEIKALSV
jgi:hypothetical protein